MWYIWQIYYEVMTFEPLSVKFKKITYIIWELSSCFHISPLKQHAVSLFLAYLVICPETCVVCTYTLLLGHTWTHLHTHTYTLIRNCGSHFYNEKGKRRLNDKCPSFPSGFMAWCRERNHCVWLLHTLRHAHWISLSDVSLFRPSPSAEWVFDVWLWLGFFFLAPL